MCLAIPGKVIEIKKVKDLFKYVIDYNVEKREVFASAVDVEVGDYVIVSSKVIIKKVDKEEVIKFMELLE